MEVSDYSQVTTAPKSNAAVHDSEAHWDLPVKTMELEK
jgi:hypothetical protein